ncbi:MAG: TonB-dependent receptor [Steroidobacteraceae bacterium]|nr:TonB-dependent receptor [Steroidobacteraceae bacterium]
MRSIRKLSTGAGMAVALCIGISQPVAAQTQDDGALAEVTVTAQRRSESLQRVPVAVSAFDTAAIDAHQVLTIRDVSNVVPNLWMETNTGLSSGSRAALRGVGEDESFFTSDPPVGIYVDDVYIPRQTGALFDLYDIERIEVLRGPQGTLYGRNTSAGAIKLVSVKPSQERRGMFELTGGDYGRFDARASISGGLTETLSGQLAVLSRQRDGYDRNLVNGARVNDQDIVSGRAALRFQPTAALDILLAYDQSRDRSTPGFATGVLLQPPGDLGPWNPREQYDGDTDVHTLRSDLVDPVNDLDQRGASLNVGWDIGAVTLRSITAWRDLDNTIILDADGQDTCFGLALPCLHLFQDQTQDQFSQELQLQGKAFDGRLDYILGAYYFNESNWQRTENAILAPIGTNPYFDTSLDTDSIALFASATWAATDRLKLTAGLRWTEDSKEFASAVFDASGAAQQVCVSADRSEVYSAGACDAGSPAGAITDPLARRIDQSWSSVTPRAALDFQLTEDAMIYASVSKGFKSGAFDGRESSTALYTLQPIAPETTLSYEVGTKAEWLGRRLRTNLALFINEIDDLQGTGTNLATGTFTRFSVGDAETRGLELEVTAKPVEPLTITASLGLLDTKYTTINFDQMADCGPVGTGDTDLQLKFSPKVSSFLGASWRIPLPGLRGGLEIGGDWTHKSSYFHSSCNPVPSREDGYDLFNAQLAFETNDGRWRIAAAVRNLGDEDYSMGQFFIPGLGFDAIYFNPPRNWSLTARYTLH